MINSYISTNNIRFGTFRVALDLPYRDGYNRLHAAIFPADLKEGVLLSLAGRVKNAVLGLVLCIPLINIIVDIAMRVLCNSRIQCPPRVQKERLSNILTDVDLQKALEANPNFHQMIRRIEEDFINYFNNNSIGDQNAETPPIFNQQLTNIQAQGYNWKEMIWIIGQIGNKIMDNPNFDQQTKAYIYYRLLAERTLMELTESLNEKSYLQKGNMIRLNAPGDGNCFIWSCILSREVSESKTPVERYQNLKTFNTEHEDYASLKRKQETLREALVEGFLKAIGNDSQEGIEFKRKFCFYFLSTPSLKEEIFLTADEEERIFETGKPNEAMLNSFVGGLATNGNWNGEFEAEIVSQHLQRPIVILNAADHKPRTIAGGQFLETNEPLFVEHTGNHYNALFYA